MTSHLGQDINSVVSEYHVEADQLDTLFGTIVTLQPDEVGQMEGQHKPKSMHPLDIGSAILLKSVMQATEQGLGVTRYVYCELPILWIVDEDGVLFFSLEEIANSETHEFVFARYRGTVVPDGRYRLGHPSLVGGKGARIGGEILFDNGRVPACWYITNGSGRYGLKPGRYADHLSNARERFAHYGIQLKESFIPTRRRG